MNAIDKETDAAIDLFHEGYDAHRSGLPRPACPDAAQGWDHRAEAIKVVVVMPSRPDGYYHAPIGTFEE